MKIESSFKKFRIFMFIYWAMMLSVSGMYTMYIAQIGFSKKEISIAVTIFTFSSLVGQSFIGYLVDKFRCVKKILFLSITMGFIVAIGIIFVRSNLGVNALIFIWGFFVYGTVPLSEAWCIERLKAIHEQKNFGRIRGFGSIGYGLSGILIGCLLDKIGWKVYPWYIFIGLCLTLFVISRIQEKNGEENGVQKKQIEKQERISVREAITEIIKIKPLMSMIIIIFMYNFVVRGIYCYLGVLVADYGGGPISLGFTYFFDAAPEIITFFLSAKLLQKFHSKKLIFIAFLLQILRLSLILIFNSALAVILLGTLSGFAFGLLAASYKTYIYELAPLKYKASCMSLCESIIGMSGMISAPVFGILFTKFGGNIAILTGLIIYILALIFILKDFYKPREI